MRRRPRRGRRVFARFRVMSRALLLALAFLLLMFGTPKQPSFRGAPVRVLGYVRDAFTQEPIPGARVFSVRDGFVAETRTEPTGRFLLRLASLGSGAEPEWAWRDGYGVRVEAKGYLPAEERIVSGLPGRRRVSIPLILLRPVAARIAISAVDELGRPVELAAGRFGVIGAGDPIPLDPAADAQPMCAGLVTAEVFTADDRWGQASMFVTPGAPRDLSIEVPVVPARVIRGSVVDHAGRPVPGATVEATGDDQYYRARDFGAWDSYWSKCAADGSFRVVAPPDADYRVRCIAPEQWWPTEDWVSVYRGDHSLRILDIRNGWARIRILLGDGSPAADHVLECGRLGWARTDAEGYCEITFTERFPAGAFRVRGPDGRPVGVIVLPDSGEILAKTVTRRLAATTPVTFEVRDAVTGAPIEDALVHHHRAFTDEWGRCSVPLVADERARTLRYAHVTHPDYESMSLEVWYCEGATVDVNLVPSAFASARLVDGRGPCPGLWVSAWPTRGALFSGGAWTDESGRVRVLAQSERAFSHISVERPDGTTRCFGYRYPWRLWEIFVRLGLMDAPVRTEPVISRGVVLDLGRFDMDREADGAAVIEANRVGNFHLADPAGRPIPDGFCFNSQTGEILAIGGRDGRIVVPEWVIRYRDSWEALTAAGWATAIPGFAAAPGKPVVLGVGSITRGVLIDRTGQPRRGAAVAATGEGPSPFSAQPRFVALPARTDTLGRFTIHGIPQGESAQIWWVSPQERRLVATVKAGRDCGTVSTSE